MSKPIKSTICREQLYYTYYTEKNNPSLPWGPQSPTKERELTCGVDGDGDTHLPLLPENSWTLGVKQETPARLCPAPPLHSDTTFF